MAIVLVIVSQIESKAFFFSFSVKLLDWGEEGHRSDAEIASLRAAFTQEVAVWHKLEHPNVTKVIFHVFTILFCFHFFHHFHGVLKELKKQCDNAYMV